eukprot:TRINITY_DN1419_c0_g3_i1.p1 TRINITY_DN1419_c0_g3~~TRINITY_DN1419_c0_g3_i1.p1  ORF type:complete len:978 (+),score=187.63 TRINITY_DN1419_c0_g3_i1:186-3119(+)
MVAEAADGGTSLNASGELRPRPHALSAPAHLDEAKGPQGSGSSVGFTEFDEQLQDISRQNSPVHMFKTKHLFVELHEYRHDHWHETHRWNHGLQEELIAKRNRMGDDGRVHKDGSWAPPHLPSVSLDGLAHLKDRLMPCAVVLDLNVDDKPFVPIVRILLDQFVKADLVDEIFRDSAELEWLERLQASSIVARSQAPAAWKPQVSSSTADSDIDGVGDMLTREVSIDSALSTNDPLKPDADEEAVHVLVDESVSFLKENVVAFVRLTNPINFGLEEQSMSMFRIPRCRYIAFVLGPPDDEFPDRRKSMGKALAALLQDDCVVNAAYYSQTPEDFVEKVNNHVQELRLMPQTTRPTDAGIQRRAQKMYEEMADVKQVSKLRRSQTSKWTYRQRGLFDKGFSISSVFDMMQRFAVPLLAGIATALVWANTDIQHYDSWAGYGAAVGDHAAPDAAAHRRLGGGGADRPTVFGLAVHGHPITLHFLVNDMLMCLFFGLAAKEISEALQPGGSLFPPTRSTVNVLSATVGGVVGPIAVYLLVLVIFDAMGLLDPEYDFMDYAIGWGVPTATDISIAWVTSLLVFGSGHPAINYLLLLAVVDDGIGLAIIAVAYPDPENPTKPQWLGLVLVAMAIAFVLRLLKCSRWQAYIILAGPISWMGLLYAAVHPSLALVFVVPFIPLKIENDTLDIASWHAETEPASAHGRGHGGGKRHPLHEFEEACKSFVDFGVLFCFGALNAGVKMDSVGVLTAAVLLALVVGKTAGIFLAAKIAEWMHCPPPAGITDGNIIAVGFIASSGLTVALFVSGEAFEPTPVLSAQAKMGALLSIFSAFIALVVSACLKTAGAAPTSAKMPTEGNSTRKNSENEDLFLEDVIVQNTVRNLKVIHKAEQAVEKKANMKRHEAILKKMDTKDLKKEKSDTQLPAVSDIRRSTNSTRSLPASFGAAPSWTEPSRSGSKATVGGRGEDSGSVIAAQDVVAVHL